MKKLFTVVAMLIMALGASAQEESENGGGLLSLFVEKFVNKADADNIVVNNLRQEIMSGITNSGRVHVVDVSTFEGTDIPTQKSDRIKFLRDREDKFDFMLEGTLNSVLSQKSVSKDGTTTYEAVINYTLALTDVDGGTLIKSDTFKDSYNVGGTADEAILKAIERAGSRMKKYVNDNFKVEAAIEALDEIDLKKNSVKTCYVSTGSSMGIEKGQIFEVFANIEVVGKQVRKKIGELKADEVMSEEMTHCSVKSGGPEIKKFFDDNIKLTVVSRAKKEALGGLGRSIGL